MWWSSASKTDGQQAAQTAPIEIVRVGELYLVAAAQVSLGVLNAFMIAPRKDAASLGV
jgi:hypothetical protein